MPENSIALTHPRSSPDLRASCHCSHACTADDRCRQGECHGTELTCAQFDGPCAMGICEEATGCRAVIANEGVSCGPNHVCRNGSCTCASAQTNESACGDGVDDDCDGLFDCAEPDCDSRQYGGDPNLRCCAGLCVSNLSDVNHCAGCSIACASDHSRQAVEGHGHCTCAGPNRFVPKQPTPTLPYHAAQ